MKLTDITAGQSWACKFKVMTFLDSEGNVVDKQLNIGERHPGVPGVYEGLGIIKVRDIEKNLVKVLDTKTEKEFCVDWNDCWDADIVEWTDSEAVA